DLYVHRILPFPFHLFEVLFAPTVVDEDLLPLLDPAERAELDLTHGEEQGEAGVRIPAVVVERAEPQRDAGQVPTLPPRERVVFEHRPGDPLLLLLRQGDDGTGFDQRAFRDRPSGEHAPSHAGSLPHTDSRYPR